jgi:glycosyltransferase involved in cell wall biosynthesis
LDSIAGGGQLSCRNHIERLCADPQLELLAVASGPAAAESGTLGYFASLGIAGRFVSYRGGHGDDGAMQSGARPWLPRRWPYLNEPEALAQPHVDDAIRVLILQYRPDCLIVDYLPSAYFLPRTLGLGVPVVMITLNREADFYRQMMLRGLVLYGRPANWIAWLRLVLAEARIHRRSRLVVTIGRYDAPWRFMGRPRTCWIAPFMDPKTERWAFSGARSLFFVGNQGHFPNRDAIEWLATRFAPELLEIAPTIRLKIVGAERADVPERWQPANVEYLGVADQLVVQRLFQSEAAFIAPIANDFGAKFKVVECIAYGTPLLAPQSAMSGVPFLSWLARLDLKEPRDAARAAKSLVEDAESQRQMSRAILNSASEFAAAQRGIWGRQLRLAGIGHT